MSIINNSPEHFYRRPKNAMDLISYYRVLPRGAKKRKPLLIHSTLPEVSQISLSTIEHYTEPDTHTNRAKVVYCGGQPFMTNGRDRVGILQYDEQPGKSTGLEMEGTFWMQLNYEIENIYRKPPNLNSKKAYWILSTRKVTDAEPTEPHLHIGFFTYTPKGEFLARINPNSNAFFAAVQLTPTIINTPI